MIFYYLRLFRIVVSTNLLYTWVTWRVFYIIIFIANKTLAVKAIQYNTTFIRNRNCLSFASTLVHPRFLVGFVLLNFLVFCVVLLCVFTFWPPCCDVRSDFRIKTMFGSCLPPVVCGMDRIFFTVCVLCCIWWCSTNIVLCFCFVCLRCVPYVARISVHSWLPSYV